MKRNTAIPILLLLFLVPMAGISQSLTAKENSIIFKKADSIIDAYKVYSTFTKNMTSVSENYITGFIHLFRNDSALVFNDLTPKPAKPYYYPVKVYTDKVKEWYPEGISVEILGRQFEPAKKHPDGFMVNVRFTKKFLGFSGKWADPVRHEMPLNMQLLFDKRLDKVSVLSIIHSGYPPVAKVIEPADTVVNEIKSSKSSNKPLYINLVVLPGISKIGITGAKENPAVTSNVSFGAGIGMEKSLVQTQKTSLSLGVSLLYRTIGSTMKLQDYYGEATGKDRAGETVVRMNTLSGVDESLRITTIGIPVTAGFRVFLTDKFTCYFKAGFELMFGTSFRYTSSAAGNYAGKYPSLNGYIFSEQYNTAYPAFGYGRFAVTANDMQQETEGKFSFALTAGGGIEYGISHKLLFFGGIDFNKGLSDFATQNTNALLSENNQDLKSILVTGNANVTVVELELGIRLRFGNSDSKK
jgi:hypothetical protein